MRSDREEIPEGFTKEQADEAEMQEARSQKARMGMRAAPGCQEYWPTKWQVCGAIRDKYNSLGGPLSFLLLPTSNELVNPDGHGRRSVFQNGPIYWSAVGGAHPSSTISSPHGPAKDMKAATSVTRPPTRS